MLTKYQIVLAAGLAAACAHNANQREVQAYGVSIEYDARDFAGHAVKREDKLTIQQNGTDIPIGVEPERTRIQFGPAAKDDWSNFVLVTPLSDRSVPDFGQAYPQVADAVKTLRAAIESGGMPGREQLDTADIVVDAEISLCARLEKIRSRQLTGYAFLAQLTQETHIANNAELRYVFAGMTADGSHLVRAEFNVKHPSLPRDATSDDAVAEPGDPRLRRDEQRLAGYPEDSFQPSLAHLKGLIRSITVGAK